MLWKNHARAAGCALLIAAAALGSASGEVPDIGPSAAVRSEVGDLAGVMAALKVHGGTPEPGFIAAFQPYLGTRKYPESVEQYAWEDERAGQRHIIVWVNDPQDREPVLLIVHAVYRSGAENAGGTLSVFRTNPSGVLLAAMRSDLNPYRPAAYAGPEAEAELAAEKGYWKAWEMRARGKPRGAVSPQYD